MRVVERRKRRKKIVVLTVVTLLFIVMPVALFLRFSEAGRFITGYDYQQLAQSTLYRLSPEVRDVRVNLLGLKSNASVSSEFNIDDLKALANIQPGDPLLFIPTNEILSRLGQIPEFQQLSIRRELNGTVSIDITLRQPTAMVVGIGGGDGTYYTDADGFVFKSHLFAEDVDFPVITGLPKDWQVITDDRRHLIVAALDLMNQVQESFQATGSVSEVHLDINEGYSLFTDQVGGKIVFGLPPFEQKVQRLSTLLKQLDGRLGDIESLDLDYNSKAFVKFRSRTGPGTHRILAMLNI